MDSRLISLVDQNARVLEQLGALVAKTSPECFAAVVDPRNGGSMGQHVRHVIEHADAVLGRAGGRVDYNDRARDRQTETEPAEAKARLERLIIVLWDMSQGSAVDERVLVRHVVEGEEGEKDMMIESTLARELVYLQSHTVHHMALIALLAEQHSIPVESDFGVAASTLRYRAHIGESTQVSA